jgi:mannose-6-phosphate isomerase
MSPAPPQPLLLEPQFVHRIWGARSLAPLFPDLQNLNEPIGEVWLTGNNCRIANGDFAGQTLADAWRAMPPAYAGMGMSTQAAFPLLLKFIFPAEKLSVQVHPDDEYARKHEAAKGGVGKSECWYVMDTQPGAEVLVGLRPDVTPELLRRAIADGTAEETLVRVPVARGELIYVPAGTMHTIGPGMILCEIQENSDITYRVFDYNRVDASGERRELHIEKALAVARFGKQLGGKVSPVRREAGGAVHTHYITSPYFAVEKWEFTERILLQTDPARFELLVFLGGMYTLEWEHGLAGYSAPGVLLLPASLGSYHVRAIGKVTLLRTFAP